MGLASFGGQWFLDVLIHYRNNQISHFQSIYFSLVPPFLGNLLKIKIQWVFMQTLALPIKNNIIYKFKPQKNGSHSSNKVIGKMPFDKFLFQEICMYCRYSQP
jgi:hypothetical protein